MADTFVMSARQAAELDHAFERNGWTPAEGKQLSSGRLLADFRQVLLGNAAVVDRQQFDHIKTLAEAMISPLKTPHIIDCDANPYLPNGWKGVEAHQKGGQLTWDKNAQKDALYLSERQKEHPWLGGHKLREELADKPVLNACVLDYLLAHPELIPEKWKGKYVFFWGTIYRFSGDVLFVRCLYWHDGRWLWSCLWLGRGWNGGHPAAVRAR